VKRALIFLSFIILMIFAAFSLAYAETAKTAGLVYAADVISVSGPDFKIKRITSPHWFFGKVNMPSYVKDLLETDKNTIACIEFTNGSQLGINKGTTIEIISSTAAKDITQRGVVEKVVIKTGTIWAKVTGMQGQEFKVETGKGVLGVKGTEFVVETDEQDNEKITVLDGKVDYTPKEGRTEELTPGDELFLERGLGPVRHRKTVQELRNALNLSFPGLNPKEQAILSIFAHHVIGSIPGSSNALGIANETLDLVEDPERYVIRKAESEIGGRIGLPIPGGIFGGGEKEPKDYKVKSLSPDGTIIKTYFPEFSWDKVENASSYRVFITRNPLVKGEKDPGYVAFANVSETKFTYPATARALIPGQTYYWSVVPLNKENKPMAAPSDPAVFTMAKYEDMGIRGLNPTGGTEVRAEGLLFDWTPVLGVSEYLLEVSADKNMKNPVLSRTTENSYLQVPEAAMLFIKGKQYYWRAVPSIKEETTPSIDGIVNSFTIE